MSFYQHRDKKLSILHCVGEYPTPRAHMQLNQIDILRRRYSNVEVGFSTHEAPGELDAIRMAIAKGAVVFEKHVGVPTAKNPLNAYSATPGQVRLWLEAARDAFAMNGVEGKRHEFVAGERQALGELRRAVFAARPIPAGHTLQAEDIRLAMPAQEGQLTASDLSKYTEFLTGHAIPPGPPSSGPTSRRPTRGASSTGSSGT